MTEKNKETPDVEADKNKIPEEQAPEEEADTPEEEDAETPEAEDGAAESGEDAPDAEISPEEKIAGLNDKLLRALAEAENVRRRAQRDKEDAAKYAITNFARDMLSVADTMRRAMDSIDADTAKKDPAIEQIMVGLEMTERGVLATFERFGIKPIDAMDRKFDHNLHEAMFELDDPSKPQGTVVQVLETGYMLNDRLLRPAKVGVSKGGPKESAAKESGAKESVAKENDGETPPAEGDAAKEGKTAYEDKGGEPGQQLDEEL